MINRVFVLLLVAALAWLVLPVPARADVGVVDVPIRAGSDDAEQRSTSTDVRNSDLELVQDGSTRQTVGLRFTGVGVPRGATVTRAYIQFTAHSTGSAAVPLTIHGQAADNPTTFTTSATSVSGRPKTAASVAWSPVAWTSTGARGPAQQTADLSPVINEIVNRSGWSSGNAMAFIVSGTTSGNRAATAYDSSKTRAAALHVEWSTSAPVGAPPVNAAPVVDAGVDQAVQLPQGVTLAGRVTDDGLPNPPARTTATWSVVSGPGAVAFADATSPSTTATFAAGGTYVLGLTGSDGALLARDDVTVTVTAAPVNGPPTVHAGADQAVTLSSGATLDGTVGDTTPTGTLTSTWTKASGPGTVTFGAAAAIDTTASFSAAGTYVLTLTASDGSASAADEVQIVVGPASAGVGTTTTLDVPVRSSSDDAEQRSASVALSSGDLNLVVDGSTIQTVGLRFTGVTVPKGTTITSAYVQFQVDEVSTGPASLTVAGQAAGDATTFTSTAGDISNRPKTTATAAWAPADWPTPDARTPAQRTPDLASVVQEIVDRSDWTTGNPVALVITGTGARVAESFDGGSAKAPVLHIEYASSGGTTNQPPTVNAGTDSSVTLPSSATLDGTVTDATPTGTLTSTWSQASGPGTVTFGNAGAVDTTASFSGYGTYVLRLTASDGAASTTDDVTVTAVQGPLTAPGSSTGGIPTAADYGFPSCTGEGRSVVRPFSQETVLTSSWRVSAPPNDTTYDLSGVASTAYPSTAHPFSFGTGSDGLAAGRGTCLIGGELGDQVSDPPAQSWEWYHDFANASCAKGVAYDWYQIHGTRCAGIEDGFRPQEPGVNANNTRFLIAGTYLTNVLDDCLENDYTVGGVVLDSLWEQCYTGVSERPSVSNGSWTSPAEETLTLDHMLIGLRSMRHDGDRGTGPNALFKWSTSGNKVVIKCSTFFVPQGSVNGADAMAIPAGTFVDDSACPDNPTTIVWLGGGPYPGDLRGLPIRVTSDRGIWDAAVADWKSRHGR